MNITLKKLSEQLGLEFKGNGDILITHACGIDDIKEGGLAYLTNPKDLANLPTPAGIFDSRKRGLEEFEISESVAIIVPEDMFSGSQNLILSEDPMLHHAQATQIIHSAGEISGKIHEKAFVSESVKLGNNVTIDANATIYDGVTIGDNTIVRAGVVIMENSSLGADCLLYPNVTIRENCFIGDRVIIHPNAVVGADGFGFFQRYGKNLKIPQIGTVTIGSDVEIGACTTIDRARFHSTVIGDGTKLDNLIHIAHNVEVGEHSLMAAQSGIAGSTKTGHHLMMGGQSGIRDNLNIGNDVSCLARTLISSKTPDKSVVAGMPSRPLDVWRKVQALINGLEGLFERVKKLEKAQKE